MKRTSGKLAPLLLAALALIAAGQPPAAGAGGKKAEKKAETYAVIIATVFRETGHALGGAELTLTATPEEAAKAKRPKPQKLVSSPRGEAVFRTAPGPMRYTLTVKAKGYKPLAKSVQIQADERQDVNFLLEVDK